MTRERFVELVKQEQEGLRRFLLTLCGGNQADADDLAQEALLLFYMEDKSIMEIALIMLKPPGTIKSYLSRGRAHLKTLMSH